MAGDTFLNLTNEVLRSFNYPETNATQFPNLQGVFSFAKDSVRNAVREVNQYHYRWPFNAYEHSQDLVVGVTEYAWPADFKYPDWRSFFIIRNEEAGVDTRQLKQLTKDEYQLYHRVHDIDAEGVGRSTPVFVFKTHGNGFGISPSPNQVLTIRFWYFRDPPDLVNATDTTLIPKEWNNVITTLAKKHMAKHRNDNESVSQYGSDAQDL